MPKLDDVLSTRVNIEEYSKFRESCESVGLKPSFTIRRLMEEVSKGNIVLKIKVKQKRVSE
tara:strand:- start:65 stop:247 length:183 start_codon:yes stop_codon:yes gene_type:complete